MHPHRNANFGKRAPAKQHILIGVADDSGSDRAFDSIENGCQKLLAVAMGDTGVPDKYAIGAVDKCYIGEAFIACRARRSRLPGNDEDRWRDFSYCLQTRQAGVAGKGGWGQSPAHQQDTKHALPAEV